MSFPPELAELSSLERLRAIMTRLRHDDPWNVEQTHRTLVKHLIEESAEVVDAVEAEPIVDDDLMEELGDVLLQVFFHAEIASETDRFTIDDVADRVSDKLIIRHPWVFGDDDDPEDMMATWEAAKQHEKQRSSALEGIPAAMPTLARAAKVVARTRHVHLPVAQDDEPITAEEVGTQILSLVQRAQASGVDADQATRDAIRALEANVREAEANAS